MLTDFEKIKLFLLSDMIDDMLINKKLVHTDKMLYTQISKNVKRLTDTYGKNTDLSEEFDSYKKQAHELINDLMNKSI